MGWCSSQRIIARRCTRTVVAGLISCDNTFTFAGLVAVCVAGCAIACHESLYNDISFTDSCLCLIARDQKHPAQIRHPNPADIDSSWQLTIQRSPDRLHSSTVLMDYESSFTTLGRKKAGCVMRSSEVCSQSWVWQWTLWHHLNSLNPTPTPLKGSVSRRNLQWLLKLIYGRWKALLTHKRTRGTRVEGLATQLHSCHLQNHLYTCVQP